MKDGQKQLVWWQDQLTANDGFTPAEQTQQLTIDSVIYLRAAITYGTSQTQFYYSTDNVTYQPLGGQTTLGYNLSVFVGARFGLFCYNTQTAQSEGYADFDWFSTETTFNETDFYPETFEGYSAEMLTAVSLQPATPEMEIMVGNSGTLLLTATYQDGHSEDVSTQARFSSNTEGVAVVQNGLVRGLKEGIAEITAAYTDPMGNELTATFSVRSTFFPFASQYINTSLFSTGTYTESTHTFKPGQWGQMGWVYDNGADMSGYRYLVVKLKQIQTCGAHLNIFTSGSIWGECYSTADFGTRKQIVVDLQNAKYTSDAQKGQPLDAKNIHIVCFWGNGGGTIVVDDMYLTNNSDYSREESTGIAGILDDQDASVDVYDLSGRRIRSQVNRQQATEGLPAGMYVVGNRKVIIKNL